MTTYSFDSVAQTPSGFAWQVQGLVAALEPAVGADKSLNYQAAMAAARGEHLLLGTALSGATLVRKETVLAAEVPEAAETMLSSQLTELNGAVELGIQWGYDQTMQDLVAGAFEAVFGGVAGIRDEPWFGWGTAASGSTTYNCNLLFAEALGSTPGSYISVLILGLTVTVELGQQQLLTLSPITKATYTVTANAIPGYITQAVQT